MKFDFDTFVERKGTNCLKYDFAKERGKSEDVLPLWVADMDFKTVPEVSERLVKIAEHGIFGYTDSKIEYFNAVANWYKKYFDWDIKEEWLVKTPGVVFAIAMAVKAFTKEGDGVIIQQPVYYPFSQTILDNNRKLVNNPLELVNGHYEMNFEDFERKIVENNVKLFVMCSPHNPVGRVWKEWELRKVGDICLKHNVIVVSDEIHCDFTYEGNRHIVFASLEKEYENITITCTAPSKTFNIAGLQASNIFIANRHIRKRFIKEISAAGYSQLNTMALAACQTAYEKGDEWLKELKEYLKGNLDFVRKYLNENMPYIKLIEPEGTYLIWLDFRELNIMEEEREDLIVNKAKLWLDSGAIFGKAGEGFERINIACSRSTLERALSQLKKALEK